jgi:gamma-glutamylcysteine synthetase
VVHLRHPDAIPEVRAAAASIWHASGVDCQARYDATRMPTEPPTFDEYLALRDPLPPVKMRVNLTARAREITDWWPKG